MSAYRFIRVVEHFHCLNEMNKLILRCENSKK